MRRSKRYSQRLIEEWPLALCLVLVYAGATWVRLPAARADDLSAVPAVYRKALIFPTDAEIEAHQKKLCAEADSARIAKWFQGMLKERILGHVVENLCVRWTAEDGFTEYCFFVAAETGRYSMYIKERNSYLIVCVRDKTADRLEDAATAELAEFAIRAAKAIFKEDFVPGKPDEVESHPVSDEEKQQGFKGVYGRYGGPFGRAEGKRSEPQLLGRINFWTDGQTVGFNISKDVHVRAGGIATPGTAEDPFE